MDGSVSCTGESYLLQKIRTNLSMKVQGDQETSEVKYKKTWLKWGDFAVCFFFCIDTELSTFLSLGTAGII